MGRFFSRPRRYLSSRPADRPELVIHRVRCEFLAGVKLVFLSDIHANRRFSDAQLAGLFRRVRVLSPDALLLGGDLAEDARSLRRLLKALEAVRPPLGTFCCMGNNDSELPGFSSIVKGHMRVLVNEAAALDLPGGRLLIGGVDDLRHGHPCARGLFASAVEGSGGASASAVEEAGVTADQPCIGGPFASPVEWSGGASASAVEGARITTDHPCIGGPFASPVEWSGVDGHPPGRGLFQADKSVFRVLLSHYPVAPDYGDTPHADLQLSGHTHGGQFNFLGITPFSTLFEYPSHKWISGECLLDGVRTIVSNGIGTSRLPLRVCVPPQLHLVVFHK